MARTGNAEQGQPVRVTHDSATTVTMVDQTQFENRQVGEPRLPTITVKLPLADQECTDSSCKKGIRASCVDPQCLNDDLFMGCPGRSNKKTVTCSQFKNQDDGPYRVPDECFTHHAATDTYVVRDAERRSRMSTDYYTARSGLTCTDATGDSSCATSVSCSSDDMVGERSCEATVDNNPDEVDDETPTDALVVCGKASADEPFSPEVSQRYLDEHDAAGEKVCLSACALHSRSFPG